MVTVDPRALTTSPDEYASQWRLIWIAFRRHKLAMTGAIVVLAFYIVAAFAEFFAPFNPNASSSQDVYHPPQMVHFIDTDVDGRWSIRPYVLGMTLERDTFTLKTTFVPDPEKRIYIRFFAKGVPYRMWGIFHMDRHLIAPATEGERFYLLGADRLGPHLWLSPTLRDHATALETP